MGETVQCEPKEQAARGRPRDLAIDEAVLAAVEEFLASVGYARLSIDMVARRAGVTRPTIYRRWRNKPELVHAALFRHSRGMPNSGDLERDLTAVAHRSARAWARPGVRAALLGLLAEAASDDDLHATVMASIEGPIRAWLATVVGEAADRGEIRADVRLDDVADLFMGPLFQHHVCNGRTDLAFSGRVVAHLMTAIRR